MYRKLYDNIKFAVRSIWKADKSLPIIFAINTILVKIQPFITILFPKYFVDSLEDSTASFARTILLIVLYVFSNFLILFMQRYTYSMTSVRFLSYRLNMKRELAEKAMCIDYQNLESEEFLNRYNRAQLACKTWNTGMEGVLRNTIALVFSFISAMGYISLLLSLDWYVCVGLILISILLHFISAKMSSIEIEHREKQNDFQRKVNYYSNILTESSYGKDIRLFSADLLLHKKFLHSVKEFIDVQVLSAKRKNPLLMWSYLLNTIKVCVFFTPLISRVIRGIVGTGSFLMYINTFTNFSTWFDEIVLSINELKRAVKETEDYRNIMKIPTYQTEGLSTISGVDSIEFKNVWFKYNHMQDYVLRDVSFKISSSERVSLVGVNGSGKTTIVKLICGFYFPTKGEVLINGIPTKKLDKKWIRDNIASVFQEVNIFAFPIRQNIALCERQKSNPQKVILSMQRAGVNRILEKAPLGIESTIMKILDETGVELSGGEKQGIALARVIYKDQASLLILDEPTSHLDALKESHIYSTYNKICQTRISIFISHRLASAKFCDKVIFIERGTILGIDKHDELLLTCPKYKEMYEIQSKNYCEE